MKAIYLIRHGQASFAEQDYDQLSEKGMKQAKMLGEYWNKLARNNAHFLENVHYYSGSLLRHEQTAEHFFNGLLEQGFEQGNSQKGMITHAGFNELDHVDILSCYNKDWQNFQDMCAATKANSKAASQAKDKREASRLFRQEFVLAMKRWVSGDFNDYQESWLAFKKRCVSSLQEVVTQLNAHQSLNERADDKALVVFTSGGVISVILGHVLQLSDQHALQISQQLMNSSVTKIIVTSSGFKLAYLNNYSHLEIEGQEWLSHF